MFFYHVSFDSIVSLGVELDNQAFDQLRNVLFLFSGVILSTGCPKQRVSIKNFNSDIPITLIRSV